LKLHILGICGTFMGGVAALAREHGHVVEGSDQSVYPPMSTQLEQLGIALSQGYAPGNISADCDEIVVGNALSRGNPAVEHVLDHGMKYTSGAQWLAEHVLPGRDTLAVAGTHGKTTTTTILSFLLDRAGTVRTRWWNWRWIAATSGKMSAWSYSRLLRIATSGR
jgi:UDP-N-acetylmuramate: L-alanyl-gamma-D-glutamyl-meso-diaminopimelate ligase